MVKRGIPFLLDKSTKIAQSDFMPVIDFHAHIYPEKIAAKASETISEFYGGTMAYSGLTRELLKSGEAIGVTHYVIHSTATKSSQVVSINNFIMGEVEKESRFIGFGTIHPDFADPEAEIERILRSGLKGIKLHPDFQTFEADSPKMDRIYRQLAFLQLPVLIHAGDSRFDFSHPRRIGRILDKFPSIRLIAAHFGGYSQWDEAFEFLAGRDLWLDTSSSFWKMTNDSVLKMIEKHGTGRILFGSDFPMWDHKAELQRFLALGLSEENNKAILYENALTLLGLR